MLVSTNRRPPPAVTYSQLQQALGTVSDGNIQTFIEDNIPYICGSFWTAQQRQAHSIHEVSYRACFKPQLPERLLPLLTRPGDVVLDPFMGRGTTIIQSALMQRQPIGSDINPLSRILTEPRLTTPSLPALQKYLHHLPPATPIDNDELNVFFHPQVLGELTALKTYLLSREVGGKLGALDKWVRMVATNRLTGHSNGFFSVKTMPPNQAVSLATQQRLNSKNGLTPPQKNIPDLIMRKSKSLLRSGAVQTGGNYQLLCSEAFDLPQIADSSVSAIITSPPFLDMVDYRKDNWLRCWFNGIDASKINIQTHHSIKQWQAFIRRCFIEFARIVVAGGYVAFEVGEARGGKVLLEKAVIEAIDDLPFKLIAVLVNAQTFTKTANCWGVHNNKQGTNTNRIILLQR